MESRGDGGRGLLIAHAICCGGPLLAILIVSNAAFLLNLVHSGMFWAGVALVLGNIAFLTIRTLGRRLDRSNTWRGKLQPKP